MSDWRAEDWDPETERREARKRGAATGLDFITVNAMIRDEWLLFEARMGAWCRRKFGEDGVAVPDWRKAKHRRQFRMVLEKRYGSSDVDPEAERELGEVTEEDMRRRFHERAGREFALRGAATASSPREIEEGIRAALAAMGDGA